jgi:hypothetical protein
MIITPTGSVTCQYFIDVQTDKTKISASALLMDLKIIVTDSKSSQFAIEFKLTLRRNKP